MYKDWQKLMVTGGKDTPWKQKQKAKQAGAIILVSDKTDFKATIKKDKEKHYTMIKASLQQENSTILNRYASNMEDLKFIKQ